MKSRAIFFCWLLLLVPTLAAGGLLLALLQREQARIGRAVADDARERSALVAESVALAVNDVEEDMIRALREVPPEHLREVLLDWQATHPLVRNVFMWHPVDGLALPDASALTGEEHRFIERYDALFNQRTPWESPRRDTRAGEPRPAVRRKRSIRSELRSWNRSRYGTESQQAVEVAADEAVTGVATARPSGWIPWFREDGLYLLGWLAAPDSGRAGVELETMALQARLLSVLPDHVPSGQTLALLDDRGQLLYQRGEGTVEDATPRLAAVPVGALLPHWQVAVFATGPRAQSAWGGLMALLSVVLVGVFVVSVLSGGSLLLWQAHRHRRDALRKTSFVSNVSHELRTPLTTIRMYAELLRENRVKTDEKRTRYLDVIARESRRLTRLVNNVLDFSRLEQCRKTYRPEALDLSELVRRALDGQSVRLAEAGLALQFEAPDQPLQVWADRDSVEQIVLNMADNAIKYAAGGGTLAVRIEAGGNHAVVRFLDRGPGVPADEQRRIFDQFHRVDDSITANVPGCGLGLSISRRLLLDQGGDLVYRANPGGGACFEIRLPLAERSTDGGGCHRPRESNQIVRQDIVRKGP